MEYSNKHRTEAAALIRGRRLLTFRPHVRRLIEGGAYSGAALIRVNTRVSVLRLQACARLPLNQILKKLFLLILHFISFTMIYTFLWL